MVDLPNLSDKKIIYFTVKMVKKFKLNQKFGQSHHSHHTNNHYKYLIFICNQTLIIELKVLIHRHVV